MILENRVNLLKNYLWSGFQIILLGIIFGISYTQEPLYTSNQNTKFLQGIAQAGFGFLDQDWLANTLDPLPLFSYLVQITYSHFGEITFYGYFLLICGIYAYSLLGIVTLTFSLTSYLQKLIYFTLLVAIHCTEINIFKLKTNIHLHYGVAEQYILGPYFQPSTFGVFILLSIYLFLKKHHIPAILALTIAANFHPTYFPGTALITLAYLGLIYYPNKNLKKALSFGILSTLLNLPMLLYMGIKFRPTSPELSAIAQNLLVNRIPHHSFPELWLNDPGIYLQLFVILAALYFLRQKPLFWIILIPFSIATILTLTQIIFKSDLLAFTTPWRVSAFLVPLATGTLIGQFVSWSYSSLSKFSQPLKFLMIVTLTIFFIVGMNRQIDKLHLQKENIPMMNFVKAHQQANQLYLVPYNSGKFVEFRLYTGMPILINLKSHPYKDVEVIEWHNRLLIAQQFYEASPPEQCQKLQEIVDKYQISHVILENNQPLICPNVISDYQDPNYQIYRILN